MALNYFERVGERTVATVQAGIKRRSLVEMSFDILNTVWVEGEAKPTRLMYRANLSWNVMCDILEHLTDRGLLKVNTCGARRTISLTPLGTTCLQRLNEARTLLLGEKDTTNDDSFFPAEGKRVLPMELEVKG
jgi:predicted transcriptional regulator